MSHASFARAVASHSSFKAIGLDVNFAQAAVDGANFRDAQLPGANFSWVTANDETGFRDARMPYARFLGATLDGVNFRNVFAPHANFRGANISDTNFQRAFLYGADFTSNYRDSQGTAQGADFSYAILVDADFSDANLSGARFNGAVVTGADFSKAQGLGSDQLKGACYHKTKRILSIKNHVLSSEQYNQALVQSALGDAALAERQPEFTLTIVMEGEPVLPEGVALPDSECVPSPQHLKDGEIVVQQTWSDLLSVEGQGSSLLENLLRHGNQRSDIACPVGGVRINF